MKITCTGVVVPDVPARKDGHTRSRPRGKGTWRKVDPVAQRGNRSHSRVGRASETRRRLERHPKETDGAAERRTTGCGGYGSRGGGAEVIEAVTAAAAAAQIEAVRWRSIDPFSQGGGGYGGGGGVATVVVAVATGVQVATVEVQVAINTHFRKHTNIQGNMYRDIYTDVRR